MMVSIYQPHLWSKPTGVVWWDSGNGTVEAEFLDLDDQILAMDELIGATSQLQFEAFARRLAARTPHTAVWDTAEISIPPHEFLALLQKGQLPA